MSHWKLRGVTGLAPTHSAGRENLNPGRTGRSSFLCPFCASFWQPGCSSQPCPLPAIRYLDPFFLCGHQPLFFRGAKQTKNSVLSGRSRGKARKIPLMCSRVGSSVCCTGRQVTDSGKSLGLSAVFIFQIRIITEHSSLSGGECRVRYCVCLACSRCSANITTFLRDWNRGRGMWMSIHQILRGRREKLLEHSHREHILTGKKSSEGGFCSVSGRPPPPPSHSSPSPSSPLPPLSSSPSPSFFLFF